MLPAFLCTILFSISGVSGHRSAKLIGSTEADFWRLALATLLLGVWSAILGVGLSGAAFPLFVFSGVMGVGLGDIAYFLALPKLGSRLSLLLIECLSVPMSAAIEWSWLGTTLSTRQLGCGAVILTGVGIALSPGRHLKLSRRALWSGVTLCTLSALAGAYGAVLSRRAYEVAFAAGEYINGGHAAYQRLVGGTLLTGFVLVFVKRREFQVQTRAPREFVTAASKHKWQGAWKWVVINSLAGQTLGVSCMQWALQSTPSGVVLAIIAVTPIVVIPFSMVMEHERPTRLSLLGSVIAVVGVVGLTLSR